MSTVSFLMGHIIRRDFRFPQSKFLASLESSSARTKCRMPWTPVLTKPRSWRDRWRARWACHVRINFKNARYVDKCDKFFLILVNSMAKADINKLVAQFRLDLCRRFDGQTFLLRKEHLYMCMYICVYLFCILCSEEGEERLTRWPPRLRWCCFVANGLHQPVQEMSHDCVFPVRAQRLCKRAWSSDLWLK